MLDPLSCSVRNLCTIAQWKGHLSSTSSEEWGHYLRSLSPGTRLGSVYLPSHITLSEIGVRPYFIQVEIKVEKTLYLL